MCCFASAPAYNTVKLIQIFKNDKHAASYNFPTANPFKSNPVIYSTQLTNLVQMAQDSHLGHT